MLRKWPVLSEDNKNLVSEAIYNVPGVGHAPDNPYINIDLQQALTEKMIVRQGDLLNPHGYVIRNSGGKEVPSIEDLLGTANIVTSTYVIESITDDLLHMAQAEATKQRIATKNDRATFARFNQYVCGFIVEAGGYNGFIPAEERAEDNIFLECPCSRALLKEIVEQGVKLSNTFDALPSNSGVMPDERRMVKHDLPPAEAAIFEGKVRDSTQYANGWKMLEGIRHEIRTVQASILSPEGEEIRVFTRHCTPSEVEEMTQKVTDMATQYMEKTGIASTAHTMHTTIIPWGKIKDAHFLGGRKLSTVLRNFREAEHGIAPALQEMINEVEAFLEEQNRQRVSGARRHDRDHVIASNTQFLNRTPQARELVEEISSRISQVTRKTLLPR